jgi:hypothetical protein
MPKFSPIPPNGPRLVVSNRLPEFHNQLLDAITARHQVSFIYQGKLRIVEPHDYGIQKETPRLLSYQIGGQSGSGPLPNWRMFDLNKMSEFKMLDALFAGNRPAKQHQKWDKLFLRVGEPE